MSATPVSSPRVSRVQRYFRLAILACGILIAWSTVTLIVLNQRTRLIRQFAEAGARFTHEDRIPNECPAWRKWMFAVPGGIAFSRPFLVDAQLTDFGDEQISLLNETPQLQKLWLRDSRVSDKGLRELPRLDSLRSFSVPATSTENGLICLTRLPHLKSLQLTGIEITPTVVDWIAQLQDLEELDLRGVRLDASLFRRLREARPQLKIVR